VEDKVPEVVGSMPQPGRGDPIEEHTRKCKLDSAKTKVLESFEEYATLKGEIVKEDLMQKIKSLLE
jgi:hypothetical protein